MTVERSIHGSTKSGRARAFRLPPSAVEDLSLARLKLEDRLGRIGLTVEDDGPMVATSLGRSMGARSFDEGFARFCRKHGFDVSFHGLRHSCTIALLLAGVDPRTIAGQLGRKLQPGGCLCVIPAQTA